MHLASLETFEKTEILKEANLLKKNFAKNVVSLSKKYGRDAAVDALNLIELRKTDKFSKAKDMWFDKEGLEMATSEKVAFYRAKKFSGEILELGCGIGGDSIALAGQGNLFAVDKNQVRVEMAKHNLQLYGRKAKVECRDFKSVNLRGDWIFFDPQRRGNQIKFDSTLKKIKGSGLNWAIKLAPAFKGDGPVEWISMKGELREACLWSSGERKATVLPSGESILSQSLEPPEVSEPKEFLLEPDPSIIVSGLFGELAKKYPASRIDEKIAYLTSEQTYNTQFFTSQLRILAKSSGDLSRVKERLKKEQIGPVEIKCRGFPVDPERLRMKLSGEGKPGVVVFTRNKNERVALICKRVTF